MATVPCDSARAFAELALGALVEDVGRSTRRLARLRAELEQGAWDEGGAAAWSSACGEIERQGWLFGWLASELGSDVLFERRERRGIARALELVARVLAQEGREAPLPEAPELDAGWSSGTVLCAVIARCAHAAAGAGLRFGFERTEHGTRARFDGGRDAALERALIEGAMRLPGARAIAAREASALCLPAGSVVWP